MPEVSLLGAPQAVHVPLPTTAAEVMVEDTRRLSGSAILLQAIRQLTLCRHDSCCLGGATSGCAVPGGVWPKPAGWHSPAPSHTTATGSSWAAGSQLQLVG